MNNALIWILSFVYTWGYVKCSPVVWCIQSHGIRAKKSIWSSLLILHVRARTPVGCLLRFFVVALFVLSFLLHYCLRDKPLAEEFGRCRLLKVDRLHFFFLLFCRRECYWDNKRVYVDIAPFHIPEILNDSKISHHILYLPNQFTADS